MSGPNVFTIADKYFQQLYDGFATFHLGSSMGKVLTFLLLRTKRRRKNETADSSNKKCRSNKLNSSKLKLELTKHAEKDKPSF